MTAEVNITFADGWRRYENKTLKVPVVDDAGAAVDLSAVTPLRVIFMRQHGDPPILTKTSSAGVTVEGDDDNVVATAIDSPDDYEDLPAGVYAWQGWDDSADVQLWFGDAYLGEGTHPSA